VRGGLTEEIEQSAGDITRIAIHSAARVAAEIDADETIVLGTVGLGVTLRFAAPASRRGDGLFFSNSCCTTKADRCPPAVM